MFRLLHNMENGACIVQILREIGTICHGYFIVEDDIEYAHDIIIPLWMFGLNYGNVE